MNIIITGTTGMIGEGILLECLKDDRISAILSVSRKPTGKIHPKLKEYIVSDFLSLQESDEMLKGYDACFFCAGISSIGVSPADYERISYDTTLQFAKAVGANQNISFVYVSGSGTDSTEKGSTMWARVKGRTENALAKLPFKAQYNFRPGGMLATKGQKNSKWIYTALVKVMRLFSPKSIITFSELGKAMINAATKGYEKNVLEISDIKKLAKG